MLIILAIVALTSFFDLRADAGNSTAALVGANLTSATQRNFAAGSNNGTGTVITGCDSAQLGALLGGGIPVGYTIGGTAAGLASGASRSCTITYSARSDSMPQAFTIIGCANANCT